MYNNVDEAREKIYKLMENMENEGLVEEGFFSKLKEKRAEKKALKAEKRANQTIDSKVVITEKEFKKYEKEFIDVVKHSISILKKEIPNCELKTNNINDIKRSSSSLNSNHEMHRLAISVFSMSDGENFENFKKKSKDEVLKNAENTYDCVDELIQDSTKRILNPIASKGFDFENFALIKEKDGKAYITIDFGDEATIDLDFYMDLIIKKEDVNVQESIDCDDYSALKEFLEMDDEEWELLEEGLLNKFKEKRAEKKARKEEEKALRKQKEEEEKAARREKNEQRKERMKKEYLGKFNMFTASQEESGPKSDLAKLANEVKALLKKEIPGCTFVPNKASHRTIKLDEGCVLHQYSLIIFRMDEDNKKRFVKNTKDVGLRARDTAQRTAGTIQQAGRVYNLISGNYGYNATDALRGAVNMATGDVDKAVEKDFVRRIKDPIIDMGFSGKRNVFVKEKNGMDYLGVKIEGKYSEYEITVSVKYIIKPEGYVESYEPVEELFGFGNKYKKYTDAELEKEKDKLQDIIVKSNNSNEIRKNCKALNKINKEIEGRSKVVNSKNSKPSRGKEYDGNKVRSDLKRLWQDIKRIMNSDLDIKPFVNNGLEMHSMNDIFDLSDKDAGVYESGVDEFPLVWIDLWDYKGGNPRTIIDDSPDGWHPVNHAEEKLRKRIKDLLEKYPNFKLEPYGGDWDTGDIVIGLKSE